MYPSGFFSFKEQIVIECILLNKANQAKVNFTNFCITYQIKPELLAGLLQLVERRAWLTRKSADSHQTEQSYQKQNKEDEVLMQSIISLGKEMRMEIEFPASYPSVKMDGKDIFLPLN